MIKWEGKQQFQIRLNNREVKSINASRMIIEGFEDFIFFVHTSNDNQQPDYVVSEASTGSAVGRGEKWYDAVKYAEINLTALGKEKFAEHINHLIKKFGSPLNQDKLK